MDYTIKEFLEIVHYCAQRCQTASPAVCSAVAEQLNMLAGSQVCYGFSPILVFPIV